jgi:ABC-type bacteriocin/lantibiotic exporter with double-glycine peptidase domain
MQNNSLTLIGHATSILFLIGFIVFISIIRKGLQKNIKRSRKAVRRRKAAGFKRI